jgi:hypothetical protein
VLETRRGRDREKKKTAGGWILQVLSGGKAWENLYIAVKRAAGEQRPQVEIEDHPATCPDRKKRRPGFLQSGFCRNKNDGEPIMRCSMCRKSLRLPKALLEDVEEVLARQVE